MENDTAAKKTEERPHRSGPVLTMARSRRKETIFVWAMLALPIVHFCIFYVWLNFNSILMSFQEGYEMEWVDGFPFLTGNIRYGFQNFLSIFQDKDGILTKILPNTLKYFGVNLLLMLPLSLIVSYFLYKKSSRKRIFPLCLFPSRHCLRNHLRDQLYRNYRHVRARIQHYGIPRLKMEKLAHL